MQYSVFFVRYPHDSFYVSESMSSLSLDLRFFPSRHMYGFALRTLVSISFFVMEFHHFTLSRTFKYFFKRSLNLLSSPPELYYISFFLFTFQLVLMEHILYFYSFINSLPSESHLLFKTSYKIALLNANILFCNVLFSL